MNKLLLLCLLAFAPISLATADLKVAVVDLSQAFDQYYKTKDAQDRIREKQENYQKDYQDMKVDYDHMVDEAQKLKDAANDPTLSAEARADKNKALGDKVQDLRTMEQKIQETVSERNKELQDETARRHKEIVDEITKVVNDFSGPAGYDLVLDSAKLIDITADVIKQLNSTQPAGGAPTGAAPSGAADPAIH